MEASVRIDLSWGPDRARTPQPAARIAEILLGEHVSARSFGPALNWLDVLFVPLKGRNKPLKGTWRWRGTQAEHLIMEAAAPALEHMTLEQGVRALIEAVPDALARAGSCLDPQLGFDLEGAQAAVLSCLSGQIDSSAIRRISVNLAVAGANRMAATRVGHDALRREWRRPLTRPLRWVRVHAVGKAISRSRPLADACRMVGGLIGSALAQQVETPGYDEIYVNLGTDDTTVRYERTALEDWCENAWAVVGEPQLAERDPARLRRTVFDAAREALLVLAEVDHLDGVKIARLLGEIDVDGLATVFVHRRMEHASVTAQITYSLGERNDHGCILRPIFHLEAMDLETGSRMRWPLGPIDLMEAGRALTKLRISSREIRIDVHRKSLRFPLSHVS